MRRLWEAIPLPYDYKGIRIIDVGTIEVGGERWEACASEDDGEGWSLLWPSGDEEQDCKMLWPSDVRRIVADLGHGFEPPDIVFERHLDAGEPMTEREVNRIVDAGLTEREDWAEREEGLFGHVPSFPDRDWLTPGAEGNNQ